MLLEVDKVLLENHFSFASRNRKVINQKLQHAEIFFTENDTLRYETNSCLIYNLESRFSDHLLAVL